MRSVTSIQDRDSERKLLIIPSFLNTIGGTTFTTFLLIKGIHQLGWGKHIRVFVGKGSLLEDFFIKAGFIDCLEVVNADSFFPSALQRVDRYPSNYPVLLYNTVSKDKLSRLLQASLSFRLNKRPVYHSCHDLCCSQNFVGNLARRVTFACLSPQVICNSQYTASHVRSIMPNIRGILHPPIDLEKISQRWEQSFPPPENLKPILASGAKIILTPTRINKPGIVNDKNLRALLPVLAELNKKQPYHLVIIGQDSSKTREYSKDLLQQAKTLGVENCFSILPPTLAIEDYYKFSDLVLTLAPREPFGRTVVEAISCGIPVIGSNTGGIYEILQNFAPHWTVDPQDPVGIADRIIKLEDAGVKENIIKGQRWIEQNCSVLDYTKRMIDIVGLFPQNNNRLSIN